MAVTGESHPNGDGRLIAGRYRTVEKLGRGGMGTVWRAVDETLGREVAVKELRAFADDDDVDRLAGMRLRMQREARAAARVRHPGVVAVHDVTDNEGHPVIVMELIEGASLDDVMREQGVLDPRYAAKIGAEVLGALDAAHRAGVLHRDVKPGNILLERGGRVVLTDFGIAAIDDPGDGAETHLTRSGELVGSLDYLAPERARGEQPGPPSDIWSLGATLYAAVEGGTPFRRTSTWSTITAIVTEPLPEPRRAGPLAPALHALLGKDPASRPDAAQAARLLTAIATDQPLPVSSDAPGTMNLGGSVPSAHASVTPATPAAPVTPAAPATSAEPSAPERDVRPPAPAGTFGPPPDLNRDAGSVKAQPQAANTDQRSPAGPGARRSRSLAIVAGAVAVLLIGGGVTYLTIATGSDTDSGGNVGKDGAVASPAEPTSPQGDGNTPSQKPSNPGASKSGDSDEKEKEKGDQAGGGAEPARSQTPEAEAPGSSGETEAAPTPSASESTGAGPTYQFVNAKSGKCLSLDNGGSTANGTRAVQWTCTGGAEQRWYWAGPSSNMLKNVKTGKCLSIANHGSTANGAQAVQSTCVTDWDAPEQQWARAAGGALKNGKSAKCLSTENGGSTANGARAIQSTCITDWNAPEQQWKLTS
ncbi:protein kinase [Streptomyces sp. NPDC059010]|uniref:serine/threonine protein kinase n=1 Tax=Streptomyces sp. NPDC059010 TaxID=3346695 RepID=UPI00369D9693